MSDDGRRGQPRTPKTRWPSRRRWLVHSSVCPLEAVGKITLWCSVRPRCLCGERFLSNFTTETRRTTELTQRKPFFKTASLATCGYVFDTSGHVHWFRPSIFWWRLLVSGSGGTSMSTPEMREQRRESPVLHARLAGGLWWLCIATGMVGFIAGLPLIVANDPAATAANILAKESSYRIGFAADVMSGVSYLGVTAFMYYVLKPVSRSLSLLAAFFGLAGIAIGSGAWISHLMPLVLLHGERYLTGFTTSQLQAAAMTALKLQVEIFNLAMLFFGVQCILIGCLVARSIFLPRILGVLLAIGGTTYTINFFANFLTPALGARLVFFIFPLAIIGEGSLGLWLLVKGVNENRWYEQASAAERTVRV